MRYHIHRLWLKLLGYKLARVVHHELQGGSFATEAFYARKPGGTEKRVVAPTWVSEEEMR